MKMKTKNGISLIVLVLTIIVLSILATAVIITLNNTNIMSEARKTTFKSDMASFKEAYELYKVGLFADNPEYDVTGINATYNDTTFKAIFGENVSEKYNGLKISKGQLQYEGTTDEEKEVLKSLNISDGIVENGGYMLHIWGDKYIIDENTTWNDMKAFGVTVTTVEEETGYGYDAIYVNGYRGDSSNFEDANWDSYAYLINPHTIYGTFNADKRNKQ